MLGNKSKMDFPGAVWLVASSGGERQHLPVYSRLAVTRQPSSDRLARHESCSAPSVIRPYVLNARVCTYVRVRVFAVCGCLRVHTTLRYQPVCRHQPTGELLLLSPLRPRCLSVPLISSFLPSFLRSRLSPFPSAPNSKRMRREEEPAFLRRNTDVRASVSRSSTWNTACPRTKTFDHRVDDVGFTRLLKMSYTSSSLSCLHRRLRVNELDAAGTPRKLMNFLF